MSVSALFVGAISDEIAPEVKAFLQKSAIRVIPEGIFSLSPPHAGQAPGGVEYAP